MDTMLLLSILVVQAAAIWTQEPELLSVKTKMKNSIGFYALTMPARLDHVKSFAQKHGMDMQIVPGVVARDLNETRMMEDGEIVMTYCPPTIAVALAQGHRNALKAFLKSNNNFGMIFEDDVAVGPNQDEDVAYGKRPILKILDEMASTSKDLKWDWLNLGRCIDHCLEDKIVLRNMKGTNGVNIVESSNSMCAHSYMVTRRGAEQLLRNTWPFYAPWDVMPLIMDKASRNNEFKFLSTTPRLFDQDRTIGPSLHTDSNPECFPEMATRFSGEQWVQVDKHAVWTGPRTLKMTGNMDMHCPSWVKSDDE